MAPALLDVLSSYWSWPLLETNLIILLNLLGALLLGLMVGYERSYHGRAAGMRTYGLVCMASCALTVFAGYSQFWFGHGVLHSVVGASPPDPTRVVQGIVTGIGFLGAGVIMKEGLNISGLTTAASIWTASAIGVMVGVGFYAAAILLAMVSGGLMMWAARIERWLPARHAIALRLRFRPGFQPDVERVNQCLQHAGYVLATGSISVSKRDNKLEWRFVIVSLSKKLGAPILRLSNELQKIEGLEEMDVSHARN